MNIQLEIRIVLHLLNLPIVFVLSVKMLVEKLANVLHNNLCIKLITIVSFTLLVIGWWIIVSEVRCWYSNMSWQTKSWKYSNYNLNGMIWVEYFIPSRFHVALLQYNYRGIKGPRAHSLEFNVIDSTEKVVWKELKS